ncbi:MAG: sulfate adenylyltransferase [Chelatococcus sp.]|nr:MAG: sulfate adenylyltransferase [Chelatococcus sp.]
MAASALRRLAETAGPGDDGAANDHGPVQKPALRFFTCGSVDDGKSTLIGRLLHEAGAVPEDQQEALARDSRRFGTQGAAVDYALLVDGLAAEREQGITIDVAYRYFATPRRSFVVADTPGHEQYTRNMATGASTAELAIILVDARLGLLPQTRRHSSIVSLVGVRSIVLAVNKMDLVGYDEAVFARIVADYAAVAEKLGFDGVTAIPISARDGDNVAKPSAHMPWYRGPALLPFLETVEPARPAVAGGAILPVQWVNRPNADFRGYSGTLARGALAVGDAVAALPSGRTSRIARILAPSGEVTRAVAGQPVTITLADQLDISRGDVVVADARRPVLHRRLTARLLWTGETPMSAEDRYVLKLATTTAAASIAELHHALDLQTLGPVTAQTLRTNDIGLASLELDRPVVALDFAASSELGGFILIDKATHATVALGFVTAGEAGASTTPTREHAGVPLRTRVADWIGPADSMARALRSGQAAAHAASGAAILAALWLLTKDPVLAAGVALADLLLRPLAILGLKLGAVRLWRWRRARAVAAAENAGGGGI